MAMPLLMTKFHSPQPRPDYVSRPRLVRRIDGSLAGRLTLISAPAGSGKTTLLSEWVAGCEPGKHVAWLSLDELDNDPVRFLSYLTAAFQTIDPGFGQAVIASLQSPHPIPTQVVLTNLINELAGVSDKSVLVLDDYHLISSQSIHDTMVFLLEHLPPQLHLIVATRADPPLPLARLRARGQMIELRGADLRFTAHEAAVFLTEVMGLPLSEGDVQALEIRTEGWIAGLYMAALSMQGRDDIPGFVVAFAGSNRYILDYLTEEVLDQQAEDMRAFLLRTSILDRMTGPVCDAVTGGDDGQIRLEQLDESNLFVIALDNERCWYRYHRLFADLLRKELQKKEPDQVRDYHRRATRWYEQMGHIAEAIEHALVAQDISQAALLIEDNALAMMDQGQLAICEGWLEALPKEVVCSRPWLSVAYAWLLVYTGHLHAVQPRLQDAEQSLKRIDDSVERLRIEGHIAAIRAYQLALGGDSSGAQTQAKLALRLLPEDDLMARGNAALTLGSARRDNGDLAMAAEAFSQAGAASQKAGNSHVAVLAMVSLAWLQIEQGHLRQAAATYQDVVQLASQHAARGGEQSPGMGMAYACKSAVLREWNELEDALSLAQKSVALCERWGQANLLVNSYANLAVVLHSRGDVDGALKAIAKGKQIARDLSPYAVAYMAALQARLRLAQGDDLAAFDWAQNSGLSTDDEIRPQDESQYIAYARILSAQGMHDAALRLLAQLLALAEEGGRVGTIIAVSVLEALILQAQSNVDRALTALQRALARAEPEGYVRLFVDEGESMATLLRQAASRGIHVDYVVKLLAALPEPESKLGTVPIEKPTPGAHKVRKLVEPLSERELEVLRLVAAGLSNRQIADRLVLAIGTVKKHTNNIYGKLGVRNRAQAIIRAQDLDLL